MTENLNSLLDSLVSLSKLDARIVILEAEQRKISENLRDIAKLINKYEEDFKAADQLQQSKKAAFEKEEKFISFEKQKLNDRRKALSSLGDYKLQTAAEKEIEFASKQLAKQEEKLFQQLEELEKLSALAVEKEQIFKDKTAAAEKFRVDASEKLKTSEVELAQKREQRAEAVKSIDSGVLKTYDRAFTRNPNDPVTAIQGQSCGGCFMTLGPQVIAEAARGESLVCCKSCGRIIFLAENV